MALEAARSGRGWAADAAPPHLELHTDDGWMSKAGVRASLTHASRRRPPAQGGALTPRMKTKTGPTYTLSSASGRNGRAPEAPPETADDARHCAAEARSARGAPEAPHLGRPRKKTTVVIMPSAVAAPHSSTRLKSPASPKCTLGPDGPRKETIACCELVQRLRRRAGITGPNLASAHAGLPGWPVPGVGIKSQRSTQGRASNLKQLHTDT